jgi:hypothetical protein
MSESVPFRVLRDFFSSLLGREAVPFVDRLAYPDARVRCGKAAALLQRLGPIRKIIILYDYSEPVRVIASREVELPRGIIEPLGYVTEHRKILCREVEVPVGATEEEAAIAELNRRVLSMVSYPFGSPMDNFQWKDAVNLPCIPACNRVLACLPRHSRYWRTSNRLGELIQGRFGRRAYRYEYIDHR